MQTLLGVIFLVMAGISGYENAVLAGCFVLFGGFFLIKGGAVSIDNIHSILVVAIVAITLFNWLY